MEADTVIDKEKGSNESWTNSPSGDVEHNATRKYTNGFSYSKLLSRHGQQLWLYRYMSSRHLHQQSLLTAAIVIMLGILGMVYYLFAGTSISKLSSTFDSAETNHEPYFAHLYKNMKAALGTFPLQILTESYDDDFCSICNCHAIPPFYSPTLFSKLAERPLLKDVHPTPDTVDINEYMRKTILDMYCAYIHLTPDQALRLLRTAGNNLGNVAAWSLSQLDLGQPTIYMTTATSPNGKAKEFRPQYFRRHGKAMKSWMSERNQSWQVVWIVAEDDDRIDLRITRTLHDSGVPFIYFAYGITRSAGNAQKNAVLEVTYALSGRNGGLFGHGPVYGLDDDNKILPQLLTLLTTVVRVGAFPVGNFARGWEVPILDNTGHIIGSNSPLKRRFPFDYGAFTFNSSVLSTLVTGPSLWKHTKWAGESEFIEQIVGNIRDVEPLCAEMGQEKCHFIWHNQPLTDLEKLTQEDIESRLYRGQE